MHYYQLKRIHWIRGWQERLVNVERESKVSGNSRGKARSNSWKTLFIRNIGVALKKTNHIQIVFSISFCPIKGCCEMRSLTFNTNFFFSYSNGEGEKKIEINTLLDYFESLSDELGSSLVFFLQTDRKIDGKSNIPFIKLIANLCNATVPMREWVNAYACVCKCDCDCEWI